MEQRMSHDEYMDLMKDYIGSGEFHCVEFTRKVRDKMYKEENGLPADEEAEYIERVRRIEDERYYAYLESKGVNVADFKRVYAL
jgi:hypothetical protein